LGVRGGAGTTTLAINLSAVVAEGETNIILADLQHGAGMVSYALRLSEGTGLAHLLDLQVDELSKEEVENQLVILSPGLRLLLADYRPGESLTPAVAPHVERIIGILSQLARLVVLDMGNKPGHTVFNSLRHVDRVLMCIAPERTSIRLAQNLLSQAERSGIGRNRFSCVLMNTAPLIPASYFRATESQLGLEVLGNVTSVPELARMAGDQAKPMVAVRPDSPTATEFRQLGERVLAKLDRLRG
jgi:MinD-like ATPase involved in chromosome partitioning or flagellar assembly